MSSNQSSSRELHCCNKLIKFLWLIPTPQSLKLCTASETLSHSLPNGPLSVRSTSCKASMQSLCLNKRSKDARKGQQHGRWITTKVLCIVNILILVNPLYFLGCHLNDICDPKDYDACPYKYTDITNNILILYYSVSYTFKNIFFPSQGDYFDIQQ